MIDPKRRPQAADLGLSTLAAIHEAQNASLEGMTRDEDRRSDEAFKYLEKRRREVLEEALRRLIRNASDYASLLGMVRQAEASDDAKRVGDKRAEDEGVEAKSVADKRAADKKATCDDERPTPSEVLDAVLDGLPFLMTRSGRY